MVDRRHRRLSLLRPVILFVVILLLICTLTVLWHVRLVHDYHKLKALAAQDVFHWTFIAMGSVLFLAIIVLSSILGGQLISHIKWSRRQSNFIASVSHELNSPLSSIKLFAQTLRNPALAGADRQTFVEKILFDVERLQRLIANILRAAEVDNRGDELQVVVQRIELYEYLRGYIHDAGVLKAGSGLRISLVGEPRLWIRLDPMMFRQVLDNLIDNAIRYRNQRPPHIELRVERVGQFAQIQVNDRGRGASAEDLPKLFDRFYRGTRPRGQREGTGIGLFVVRLIVEAHGGRVRAASEGPGLGMSISIRLPIEPSAEPPLPEDPFVELRGLEPSLETVET